MRDAHILETAIPEDVVERGAKAVAAWAVDKCIEIVTKEQRSTMPLDEWHRGYITALDVVYLKLKGDL